jgi:hypothetical protein
MVAEPKGGIVLSESDEHTPEASEQPEAQPEPPAEPAAAEQPAAEQQAPVTAPPPTAANLATTGGQGPIGKPRGVAFVILISLITLGIYHLYWVYKVFDELKQHTGAGIGGVLGLVIAIVFNPVNWFVMPSEVGNMYAGDGQPKPMTGWTGLWILLPIIGWFVWTAKIQGALNRYWESKGATA